MRIKQRSGAYRSLVAFITAVIMFVSMAGNSITVLAGPAGTWIWPFPTSKTVGWGYDPNNSTNPHYGIDVSANTGDPIIAPVGGTIYKKYTGCNRYGGLKTGVTCKAAGQCSPNHGYTRDGATSAGYCNNGYGNGICLKTSDNYYIQFAHMSSVNGDLYEGQEITAGTLLGYVGGSGYATGKHCHYQIGMSEFGSTINPMSISYTDDPAPTPVSINVSYSDYTSKQEIGYCDATVAKTISVSGVSISSVEKVGAALYSTANTQLAYKEEVPQTSNGVINAWYTIGFDKELNYTLSASTTYKYRFFARISGNDYWSDYFSFTTLPDPSPAISFTAWPEKESIQSTNAVLARIISVTNASINDVSTVGIELFNSAGTMIGSKTEIPQTSGSVIRAWYDVNGELGVTLSQSTTYKYRFLAVIGGKPYYSDYELFTTGSGTISASFRDYPAQQWINTTTLSVAKTMSVSGASISSVSKVGIDFYNSEGTILKSKEETPTASGSVINIWYSVGAGQELDCTLTPGTTYIYRFKAVINGTPYYSETFYVTTNPVLVTGITLSRNKLTLNSATGAAGTITAAVAPSDATNKSVTWSSDKPEIATVYDGVVRPISPGTAVITCAAADGSGVTAQCTVTVKESVVIRSVSVSQTALVTGDTGEWTVSAESSEGSIVYRCCLYRNGSVYLPFEAASSGTVSYRFSRPGEYYLEVTASDSAGNVSSTVSSETIMVTQGVASISLNRSSLVMALAGAGSVVVPGIEYGPAKAAEVTDIKWSSSNEDVVRVGNGGTLEARSAGSAVVTASVEEGPSASCRVVVNGGLNKMVLPMSLEEVEEEAFEGMGTQIVEIPESAVSIGARAFRNCTDLLYVYIPDSVTDIGEGAFEGCSNVILLCDPGSAAHSYAVDNGIEYSPANAGVEPIADTVSVSLNRSSLSLEEGEEFTLSAAVTPDDGSGSFAWYSDNPAVASVSSEGVVTALEKGSAIISAVYGETGVSASCIVTVTEAEVVPTPAPEPEHDVLSFADIVSTPKATDAYVFVRANAEASGSFTKSGIRIWNSAGTLVASKDETHSYSRSSLDIWYNVTEETGSVLTPSTTYRWKIYTIYNGVTYWTEEQSFTTLPQDSIVFTELRSSASATNTGIHARGTSDISGNFTKSGFRMWDSSGNLVASQDEDSVYTLASLEIWYDITSDTGVVLHPNSTYTWQIYTIFNGKTYWTPVQTVKTLTTAEAQTDPDKIPHPIITGSNNTRCIYPSVLHLELGTTTNASTYAKIIDQFDVTYGENNSSLEGWYEPHTTYHRSTYCNYFAVDVSYAMGAFLPLRSVCAVCGKPSQYAFPAILSGNTTSAGINTTITYMRDGLSARGLLCTCSSPVRSDRGAVWLHDTWFSNPSFYEQFGWVKISYSEARSKANAGYLTIGSNSGHVFVVHPNSAAETHISQAGGDLMDNEPIPNSYKNYDFFYNRGL